MAVLGATLPTHSCPEFREFNVAKPHLEYGIFKVVVKLLSSIALCDPFTVARQALSMGFPRQEYWSGLLFPPPGDLSYPGIKPTFPVLQADSLPLSHQGRPKFCFFF